LKIRDGKLDIVVCCRSNDIIYGAYGSNVVQFSVLQEYLAAMIGVSVGTYYQVSDSWHAYTARWDKLAGDPPYYLVDYYEGAPPGSPAIEPYPMVIAPEMFDHELRYWMAREFRPVRYWANQFFPLVAEPLWQAWIQYKDGDTGGALKTLGYCRATDWRLACGQWIQRIVEKREMKKTVERT
jgi:hypothetical protein